MSRASFEFFLCSRVVDAAYLEPELLVLIASLDTSLFVDNYLPQWNAMPPVPSSISTPVPTSVPPLMSLALTGPGSDRIAGCKDSSQQMTEDPFVWRSDQKDAILRLLEFCRHHPESSGWRHGLLLPDAIMSYCRIDPETDANRLCDWYDNHNVASVAVLGPVTHEVYSKKNNGEFAIPKTSAIEDPPSPPPLRTSPFDGLMSFSDITLLSSRNPHLLHVSTEHPPLDFINSAPKICYQNNFDFNNITYTFGGLHITSQLTLSRFDIPPETPLLKVLVYLPVKLPPHVSRKILSNPLLAPNFNMFSYCPLRSNITHLDLLTRPNDPKGICAMTWCEVSPHHVFYYGGFTIDDTVERRDDLDRYIIRRKLVMNLNGYILNTRTQRFSKVVLKPQQQHQTNYGRIGAASCAKSHRQSGDSGRVNVVTRPSSPPIQFTYTDKAPRDSPALNSQQQFVTPMLAAPRSNPISPKIVRETTPPQLSSPRSPPVSLPTKPDPHNRIECVNPARPVSTSMNAWRAERAPLRRNLSSATSDSSVVSSTLSRSLVLLSRHKMSSVFSKPARMFHKSHRRPSRASEVSSGSTTPKCEAPRHRDVKVLLDHAIAKRSSLAAEPDRSALENPSRSKPRSKKPADAIPPIRKSENAKLSASVDHSVPKLQKDIPSMLLKTSGPLRTTPNQSPRSQNPLKHVREYTSPPGPAKSNAPKSRANSHESSAAAIESAEGVYNGVTILIFGGFLLVEQNGQQEFRACSDILTIELASRDEAGATCFYGEAIILETTRKPGQTWPSPRGYFGNTVVDANPAPFACTLAQGGSLSIARDDTSIDTDSRPQSPQSTDSAASTFRTSALVPVASQPTFTLDHKELVIHGGCNEQGEVFSDLYVLSLHEMTWLQKDTFLYDYHENKKEPYDDDDCTQLTLEKKVIAPELVEAEFRSCHHTLVYYKTTDTELVMFMGGFQNDYLRFFDEKEYRSDKYDVLRLARFGITNSERNVQRVPCLDLLTYTWRYLRYYHEFSRTYGPEQRRLLRTEPWRNSRMNHHAGRFSLNGKILTVCHGLVTVTPEKKRFKDEIWNDVGPDAFWGTQVSLEFPGL